MSTTEAVNETLTYDVFVNEAPPQDGVLPNGEPKRFSPQASTLIYGSQDAVLTDPPMTTDQARLVGDWVAAKGRNVTDIFITHGHGDHWFAAGLLAERFGARVVASAGTIAQMHTNLATRPMLWDKIYSGLPPSPVTAVPVPTTGSRSRDTTSSSSRSAPPTATTPPSCTSRISTSSSPATSSTTACTCTSCRP